MTTAIRAKRISPGPLNRTPPIATSRPVRPASRRKVRSWVLRRVPVTVFMVVPGPYRRDGVMNLWDSHNLRALRFARIPDAREIQAMRRRGRSGGAARRAAQQHLRVLGGLAAARQQHRADQRAHLVAE